MRMSEKFTIIICGFLAAFFAAVLLYSLFYAETSSIAVVNSVGLEMDYASEKTSYLYKIVMIQLVVFLLVAEIIIAYVVYNGYKMRALRRNDAKLILLNGENSDVLEYTLVNKTSAIIGKFKTGDKKICFIDKSDLNSSLNIDRNVEKYALVNCVKNCWYMECISSDLPKMGMALKRGGKQCVYKLEDGYIYRLQPHDIIYIGKERLRFEAGVGVKAAG